MVHPKVARAIAEDASGLIARLLDADRLSPEDVVRCVDDREAYREEHPSGAAPSLLQFLVKRDLISVDDYLDLFEEGPRTTEEEATPDEHQDLWESGPWKAKAAGSKPGTVVRRWFGDYEILEVLGSGGAGVVFEARHQPTGEVRALKILRSENRDETVDARFKQEVSSSAKLDHPGIVPILDWGQIGAEPYLAMELIDGLPFSAVIPNAGLPPDRALRVMAQVAEAVHYAHAHAIVHRDLKPENILIDAELAPHVTDFGLAFSTEVQRDARITRPGVVVGTPVYLAPEQINQDRDPDPRIDVYAMGAILYEALTGQPPFEGVNRISLYLDICEKDPTPPSEHRPELPAALDEICLTCLAKDPDDRFRSAGQLAEALRRAQRFEADHTP